MAFTEPLDTSTVLRNLIIGKGMPTFDYLKEEFVFRTVFYRGPFSYCTCQCGIQHEYLEYIADSGEINEDIFNHIVACIDKGQFPHVNNVDSKFVAEARLTPLHVIAAAGTSASPDKRIKIINCTHCDYSDSEHITSKDFFDIFHCLQIRRRYRWRLHMRAGGSLLCLTPFNIAVLKNRTNVPVLGSDFDVDNPILKMERIFTDNSEHCIQFEATQFQNICIQNQNYALLNYIIHNLSKEDTCIVWDLETAFQEDDLNILQLILKSLTRRYFGTCQEESTIMRGCCKLAILYNKSKYLRLFLERLHDQSYSTFLDMCHTLNREECKGVILAAMGRTDNTLHREKCKGVSLEGTGPIDNSRPISFFRNRFEDLQNLKSTITAKIMATIPTVFVRKISNYRSLKESRRLARYLYSEMAHGQRCLVSLLEITSPFFISLSDDSEEKLIISLWSEMTRNVSTYYVLLNASNFMNRLRNSTSVDDWLRALVDVKTIYEDNMNPLLDLLIFYQYMGEDVDIFIFRQCLELYLYQNPDINLNRSAVELALQIDKKTHIAKSVPYTLDTTYIVDGRNHGLFGHDTDLALNMTVPLLIESGFPVPDDPVPDPFPLKDILPPEEYEYILAAREQPKSLECIVRDCLRSFFKGRQLHRVMDSANLPEKLKDIILLKPLLKSIPKRNLSSLDLEQYM